MVKGTYMGKDEIFAIDGNTVKKIVPYHNEQQTEDVGNHNDATEEISIPSFMQERYTSNRKWYYVNMEEHDAEVIRKEHQRVRELKRRKERQLRYEKEKRMERFLYFAKQKIIGLAIICATIWLCCSGIMYDASTQMNDCTFALITIPIGLVLLFTKEKVLVNDYFYVDDDNEQE